ncbi:MAG: efflux RND transporter periplasmic adaptor subunit [Alphaproteobacteria bacterium]|jgi:multidrug efflux system membrane fusion protein|nr:efflux RND transporter periplasmic adaptor subunit [Alphaproteobacteria bacterium]
MNNTRTTAPSLKKPFLLGLVLLFVGVGVWQWDKGHGHKKGPEKDQTTTVRVASATSRDIPVMLEALGSVTPEKTVNLKVQVTGTLLQIHFEEGQFVKKGDLLAEIDPRPYEAQLLQYEGELAKDQALLENAKLDLKRDSTLNAKGFASAQALDTQVWLVRQYEGAVKADQGLVDNAKVNLSHCKILAPVDGRIGFNQVDLGNIVQPSDTTPLAIINTIQPITVVFSIPEDNLPTVLQKVKAKETLGVEAYDRGQNKKLADGTLTNVDNQIDLATGTVKLKATFTNEPETLFPNQFVNVRLHVETLKGATTVPTAAIQRGAQGSYVYVLTPDQKKVRLQNVTLGPAWKDDTVITKGIAPHDTVIIEGTDRLTDGASVQVSALSAPTPKAS